MMRTNETTTRAALFRALARAWLAELRPDDLETLSRLPDVYAAIGDPTPDRLTDLAVEYQRLFGFDVPPYESVFLDPSGLLMAPATARVQAAYRRLGWTPPPARVGASDHIGLELALVGDLLAAGRVAEARQFVHEHLAFWAPLLIFTLRRLSPDPFYARLADETLQHLLTLLDDSHSRPVRLPSLPPPPQYTANGLPEPPDPHEEETPDLRTLVRHLTTARQAGIYLTRDDLGRLAKQVAFPPVIGNRQAMLTTLFRLAGQYDEVPRLLAALQAFLEHAANEYMHLVESAPAWRAYAECWLARIEETRTVLDPS